MPGAGIAIPLLIRTPVELSEAKQELWKRRLDLATGQLDGTAEITNYKREIARIHTLMREREILAHEADRQEA